VQLAPVNGRYDHIDNNANGTDPNEPEFTRSNVLLKLIGLILFASGCAVALKSHYTLLYSGYLGGMQERLVIGINGWICAMFLIWHGAILLLGM
jgi:hypothetical protein